MASLPTFILEVSTTAPTAAPSWTAITSDARLGMVVDRGRSDELNRFFPGKLALVLNNRDRDYDPTYTSSPLNGSIVPSRRVRLRATWNATTYILFDGYVDSWEQNYPAHAKDTIATVEATDGFKVLAGTRLPGESPFALRMLQYAPTSWWRFGETSTDDPATDAMGHNHGEYQVENGTIDFVPGLIAGESDGAFYPHGAAAESRVLVSNPFLISGYPFTVAAVGTVVASAGRRMVVAAFGGDSSLVPGLEFAVTPTTNTLYAQMWDDAGTSRHVQSTTNLATLSGAVHMLWVATSASSFTLYVNGSDVTSVTISGSPVWWGPVQAGYAIGNVPDVNFGAYPWGQIAEETALDEVAIWNGTALSAAQAAALANAAIGAWDSDTTGTAAGVILDIIGWRTADRDIDTGNSTIGPISWPKNATALDVLQTLADTEAGQFYMGLDGAMSSGSLFQLVWRQRHAQLTATRSNTVQATFGDGAGELPYHDLVIDYGDTTLYNEVTVTRSGGATQRASDAPSQAYYFVRTLDRSGTWHRTDNDAFDVANWLLTHLKDPQYRITELVIKPQDDPTNLYPQVLGREIGDRIRILRRPLNVGTAIDKQLIIQGVRHELDSDGGWKTTWRLSEAETQAYWILGDATYSVLGTTTRLAA